MFVVPQTRDPHSDQECQVAACYGPRINRFNRKRHEVCPQMFRGCCWFPSREKESAHKFSRRLVSLDNAGTAIKTILFPVYRLFRLLLLSCRVSVLDNLQRMLLMTMVFTGRRICEDEGNLDGMVENSDEATSPPHSSPKLADWRAKKKAWRG